MTTTPAAPTPPLTSEQQFFVAILGQSFYNTCYAEACTAYAAIAPGQPVPHGLVIIVALQKAIPPGQLK